MPMFDTQDAAACFTEVAACREAFPPLHQGQRVQRPLHQADHRAVVHRQPPKMEPGFRIDRADLTDRHVSSTPRSYAAEQPHGARYQGDGSGPEPD